ncbi:hypothetical protein [Sulfurovum sp.]|uniref:hypothetical protein n=1 Tax=Sulfurovum sp. TaxID=1969726 RepID=UPI003565B1BC
MQLEIFESNPNIFLLRFIEAVKQGYRLQNTNEGTVIEGNYFSVMLYQCEYEIPSVPVGKQMIEEYDRMEFWKKVQDHVLNNAIIDVESLHYNLMGAKLVSCVVRPSDAYTKEELSNLEWEVVKELGKKYDCFNRQRKVMESSLVRIFEEV